MWAWWRCPIRVCNSWPRSFRPKRIVPAIVEFVDIAGLVAGASQGEGLGNQFLAHIRETDAIVNVVRCFEDDNVIHVAGQGRSHLRHRSDPDRAVPGRPGYGGKSLHRYSKAARSGNDKDAIAKLVAMSPNARPRSTRASPCAPLTSAMKSVCCQALCLITAKPAMFVGNVSETGFENNPFLIV